MAENQKKKDTGEIGASAVKPSVNRAVTRARKAAEKRAAAEEKAAAKKAVAAEKAAEKKAASRRKAAEKKAAQKRVNARKTGNEPARRAEGDRKPAPMPPRRVLILNGSPRAGGNTEAAIDELCRVFQSEGVETETVQVGNLDIRGCIACNSCSESGRCVFDDIVNELAPKLYAADGLVIASPVYYASANATLVACLQRLFYSTHFDKRMKVGASIVIARRTGCSAAYDELNKFFTLSEMPVASSVYWNNVHGNDRGEAALDSEGLQTMRVLARNMTFLMKSIALGRKRFGLPEQEQRIFTNFIR